MPLWVEEVWRRRLCGRLWFCAAVINYAFGTTRTNFWLPQLHGSHGCRFGSILLELRDACKISTARGGGPFGGTDVGLKYAPVGVIGTSEGPALTGGVIGTSEVGVLMFGTQGELAGAG